MEFYISQEGCDAWSGTLPAPNADRTDGPFRTLNRARDMVRTRKFAGQITGPVTVYLRQGHYPVGHTPLTFTPDDSGSITYTAYPGETPVISGGRRLTGWDVSLRADGKTVWTLTLPEVAAGRYYFRSLFVNGERRLRAHYPKVNRQAPEWLRIADVPGFDFNAQLFDGTDRFVLHPGDFQARHALQDVEVVVLHYWIEERLPVQSFDPQTNLLVSRRFSTFALRDDYTARWARYYVDNVREALTEPGEWYLDRTTGQLSYLPLPGESLETAVVVAPVAHALLQFKGDPETGRFVEYLRFTGLTFAYTDWEQPDDVSDPNGGHRQGVPLAAAPQAAFNVPGVIQAKGTRFCALEDCVIAHVGGYGITFAEGCTGNRIVGCHLHDLGAGGIHLSGAPASDPLPSRRTGNFTIADNHIHDFGRVFHSAVGILARHTGGNAIQHNHIHDGYYTGISVGWVWGYEESVSRDNHIEKNHIHDLGKRWLSDMGGIYTLGVSPGTILRHNRIYNIHAAGYGGWAIYPDEGSSHLVIENNLGYNTSSHIFHQHFGRENIVRNNIFAFGGTAQIALGRHDNHTAFTFSGNIVLTRDEPLFTGGYGADFARGTIRCDGNLYWSLTNGPALFQRKSASDRLSWVQWQMLGYDRHSLIADPNFVDPENGDFTLLENSPAHIIDFVPLDLNDIGPRPRT